MVAFVNSVEWQVDNTEHALITMPSQNVVAGNNLVAYLRFGGGVSTPTLSDTAGNTYIRVDVVQLGTTDSYIAAYYCLNCLGNASNVAEFAFPVGRLFNRAWVNQYSSTNPMAFVSYDPVTDTGTSITSAGLAASDNGILVAGAGAYSGTVSIAGDLTDIRTSGLSYVGEGDVIFSGSGTKTAAFTASPSTDLGMIAMLFSDAASGGGSWLTRNYWWDSV